MKKNYLCFPKYFLFFSLFCIMIPVAAQDYILGLKYGYGSNTFIRQSDNKKTSAFATHKLGLVAEFSPYYSHFFIISGIEFEMNNLDKGITIPLSLRVVFGNTVQPFIEGGGYYHYSLTDLSEDFFLKNDLGAKVMAGFLIKLNKNIRLELGYNYRVGITKALEEEIILPLNQIMLEEYRRKSGSIDLSVKYRF